MSTHLKNSRHLQSYLAEYQERINVFLENILPDPSLTPTHLHEAMHYVVLNGGKRIRPLLVYATGETLGLDPSLLDYPASAIELIHTYSLVHDDLPAMDNDDLRRGRPTCHIAFDEATAILVGDALQTLAFSLLTNLNDVSAEMRIAMIRCLAKASGSLGMAGGQALDLKATGKKIEDSQLVTIHHLKTGALISACVQLAILTAPEVQPEIVNALLTFATAIGLCFQVQDDILDLTGSSESLGKSVGGDQAKQKATFTTLHGLSDARERLFLYFEEAITALKPLGENATPLKLLADYIVARDH